MGGGGICRHLQHGGREGTVRLNENQAETNLRWCSTVEGNGGDRDFDSGRSGGRLWWWSEQKASGCHGDGGGCSVSLDFTQTKEGKEKGNSVAFCGRGGLVEKEMRGGGSS
jgi:hypothetical protein